MIKTFDVTKHLSRPTHAGLCYRGFIKVPTDGTWTFFATSDAGMNLRIHDSLVIDDDFNHNSTEATGSIRLAAGLHPFTLSYRTIEQTPALALQWSGPQTAKQPLPTAVLFHQQTAKR